MIIHLARLLFVLPAVAFVALLLVRRRIGFLRPLALVSTFATFLAASVALALSTPTIHLPPVIDVPWIPSLGARWHLALDGHGLFLAWFAAGVCFAAAGLVAARASGEGKSVATASPAGLFGTILLAQFAAGVLFLARDLLLFVFAQEILVLSLAWLLHGERGEEDESGPARFLVPQLFASVLLIVAFAALTVQALPRLGPMTFAFGALAGAELEAGIQGWLFAGFGLGFLIRAGAWPFHQGIFGAKRPSALSLLCAGLLAATGVYGLVAIAIPFLPRAAAAAAPWLMVVGGIGSLLLALAAAALAETRSVISSWNAAWIAFAILAVFTRRPEAMAGALALTAAMTVAFAALMRLVELAEARGRDAPLVGAGGSVAVAPRLGALLAPTLLAAGGAPLFAGFPALLAALAGIAFVSPPAAFAAVLLPVVGAAVALRLFFALTAGAPEPAARRPPTAAELFMPVCALLLLIGLGLAPWRAPLAALLAASAP